MIDWCTVRSWVDCDIWCSGEGQVRRRPTQPLLSVSCVTRLVYSHHNRTVVIDF